MTAPIPAQRSSQSLMDFIKGLLIQRVPKDVTATPGAVAPDGDRPLVPGNIDLTNRPRVKNADGSISTVRSMSFDEDGKEILVPTVSDDGRILSDEDAIAAYHKTGKHLGIFASPEAATRYAQRLHEDQAKLLQVKR